MATEASHLYGLLAFPCSGLSLRMPEYRRINDETQSRESILVTLHAIVADWNISDDLFPNAT